MQAKIMTTIICIIITDNTSISVILKKCTLTEFIELPILKSKVQRSPVFQA